MVFRGRYGDGDARAAGKSISTRAPPPPIITTSPQQTPAAAAAAAPANTSRPSSGVSSQVSSSSTTPTESLSPYHLAPPGSDSTAPSSPLSPSSLPTLYCGVLKKKSPSGFAYQPRWFTLSTYFLSYFNKPSDRFPLGYLSLSEILSISSSGLSIELGLASSSGDKERKYYKLQAETKEECELWRRHIEQAVTSLKSDERHRGTASQEDDPSPRTPLALKRPTHDSEWKEEASELEKSFFALKFSGQRGKVLSRLLMDVRSNLDILRFLIELQLHALGLSTGSTAAAASPLSPSFPLPAAISAAVSYTSNPLVTAATAHTRTQSVATEKEIDEHKEKAGKALSNPASPRASSRILSTHDSFKPDRTQSLISVQAFNAKIKQMEEKLATYAMLVAHLAPDERRFILRWLSSPSTLSALTALFLVPNSVLHDRVLRILFLHGSSMAKATCEGEEVVATVSSSYALLLKDQLARIELPSFQLQIFYSLLLILTTPLSAFARPVLPSTISFSNTKIHNPAVLRAIFAGLISTDFHLRKKILKNLLLVLEGTGNRSVLLREKEGMRWMFGLLCDVPGSVRRRGGVVRKVVEYVMKVVCGLHLVAFKGKEKEGKEEGGSKSPQAESLKRRSTVNFSFLPRFPELLTRSLLIAYQSTKGPQVLRQIIGDVVSVLDVVLFSGNVPGVKGAAPAVRVMDGVCYGHLLYLLLLVKTFVFVPQRFVELLKKAEAARGAAKAAEAKEAKEKTRRSSSLSSVPATAQAAFIAELISTAALASAMQRSHSNDPPVVDLSALLSVPLAPLSSERNAASDARTTVPPPSNEFAMDLSDPVSFLNARPEHYDVHRMEKRGLKADAELLAQVTRLLAALSAESWQNLPSHIVKGGIRVAERLSYELNFFQDASVFLLLLAPMVSSAPASAPPSAPASSSVSPGSSVSSSSSPTSSSSALLTASETSEIVSHFLAAKPAGRRKVFRSYEERYRLRELAEHKAAETRSKEIELQMQVDAEKERQVSKILLLGPSEAGKSTMFKQMKKLYGAGFNALDRQHHVVVILANLLRAMRALIFHSDRLLQRFPFSALSNVTGSSTSTIASELEGSKALINNMDLLQHFPSLQLNSAERIIPQAVPSSLPSALTGATFPELMAQCLTHLSALWADPGVQLTYENRAKFDVHQLYDGDGFFLSRLREISDVPWMPSEEDVIRTRIRSLGVSQFQWEDASGHRYRMTDIAGQRSERKKWMGFFHDASCVMFVAALSEYDQVLAEEPTINRMQDALQTFQQLSSLQWFDPIPLVLLLNKADLYHDKIQRVSLRICFPKYRGVGEEGGNEAEHGLQWIKSEFLKRVRPEANGAPRPVFVHVVSAVHSEAARVCMKQIDRIVRERRAQQAQSQALMQ